MDNRLIVKRFELYNKIQDECLKNGCSAPVRGIMPFGNRRDDEIQSAYVHEGFAFCLAALSLLIDEGNLTSKEVEDELLDMINEPNMSLLVVQYIKEYLTGYLQNETIIERKWTLNVELLLNRIKEKKRFN